ncbi:hypothetical protein C0992_001012 [Termitomyces sp. T32_za158]|nr:hypothetical protein C0992_001012 [Termitomyces sp. T32_za158]
MSLQAQAVFDFAAVESKAQLGKKTEIHMGEPRLAGQVGPLSAPVTSTGPRVNKEAAQWKLEVEELWRERVWGYALAQEWEEELGRVRRKWDKVVHACDLLLHEQDEFQERREAQDEVDRLQVQLVQAAGLGEAAGPTVITAAEINELVQGLQEVHELEGRQHEWLLCEVVEARDNALTWAREHCLLLDGLSSEVSYVMEEAASADLPLGLAQEVAWLGRLLAVHCHCNLLNPGSWLEAFIDGLQDSPSVEKIVEIVREAIAAEFGLGVNRARGPAGGAQGPVAGA